MAKDENFLDNQVSAIALNAYLFVSPEPHDHTFDH